MTQEQIDQVKYSPHYYDARNRAELPGKCPDMETCELQAMRLWDIFAVNMHGEVMEPDFVHTIGMELFNDIKQDYDKIQQEKAVKEVTRSQDTLYCVINRTDKPQDVSGEYPQHWRVFRDYIVTDLAASLLGAFVQIQKDLTDEYNSEGGYLRIDVRIVDTDSNYNSVIDWKRLASIETFEYVNQISLQMTNKLIRHIEHMTGQTEFNEVEFVFNKVVV